MPERITDEWEIEWSASVPGGARVAVVLAPSPIGRAAVILRGKNTIERFVIPKVGLIGVGTEEGHEWFLAVAKAAAAELRRGRLRGDAAAPTARPAKIIQPRPETVAGAEGRARVNPEQFWPLIDQMADVLYKAAMRTEALSRLLVERGVFSEEELSAKMAVLDEAAIFGVEFSDKPEHVAYRNLRRAVRQAQEGEEPPGNEPDAGPRRNPA